jgi:hypothetical protein
MKSNLLVRINKFIAKQLRKSPGSGRNPVPRPKVRVNKDYKLRRLGG